MDKGRTEDATQLCTKEMQKVEPPSLPKFSEMFCGTCCAQQMLKLGKPLLDYDPTIIV